MTYKIEDVQEQYLDWLEHEDELDNHEMQQKFLKWLDNWEPDTDNYGDPCGNDSRERQISDWQQFKR